MRKLYKTAYHTNPMLAENKITLASLYKILFEEEPLTLSDQCMQKLEESFHFLKTFSNDKIIYGINTGFGPMAQYRIEDESLSQLQYNIIRSHATGAGQPLPELYVKAAMIARLYTFLQGKSGVHKELALLITEFINRGITPYVPEHGSVGASGDLVQLAHIALTLIGEGEVFYQGKKRDTASVLAENGLQPLQNAYPRRAFSDQRHFGNDRYRHCQPDLCPPTDALGSRRIGHDE